MQNNVKIPYNFKVILQQTGPRSRTIEILSSLMHERMILTIQQKIYFSIKVRLLPVFIQIDELSVYAIYLLSSSVKEN